jgi:hypothetical protein
MELIKGRLAEALVESMFTRAEFKMTRSGKESDLRGTPKEGKEADYSPDFLAMKEVVGEGGARGSYQTHMIGVKYRMDLTQYLWRQSRARENSEIARAKEKWPSLCVVFVTDRPASERSSFQALDLSAMDPGKPFDTVELYEIKRLNIFTHNVEQHEELAKKLFGLLSELSV